MLIEPFLVRFSEEQVTCREDLAPKIEVVRGLAREFDAVLSPADVELDQYAVELDAEAVAFDGVRRSDLGHQLLADSWLRYMGL